MAAAPATALAAAATSTTFDASDVPLGAFAASHDGRCDWRAAPIEPSWILEGTPQARYIPLARGADGFASTTLWDCSAGSFRWWFGWDETVHILDGSVEVRLANGQVHRLSAGSIAFFPAGTSAIWTVEGHVRKLAVCRRACPGPMVRALECARRLKQGLARLPGILTPGLLAPGRLAEARIRYATAAVLLAGLGLDLAIDIV